MDSVLDDTGEELPGGGEQQLQQQDSPPLTNACDSLHPTQETALPVPPLTLPPDLALAASTSNIPSLMNPGTNSNSLYQELRDHDMTLNLSAIAPPPYASLSNSTPIRGNISAFSALGIKRPAADFARIGKQAKKKRLLVPNHRPTINVINDSGLDKTGVDSTNMSCGTKLREDSYGSSTLFRSLDGNTTITSPDSPALLRPGLDENGSPSEFEFESLSLLGTLCEEEQLLLSLDDDSLDDDLVSLGLLAHDVDE